MRCCLNKLFGTSMLTQEECKRSTLTRWVVECVERNCCEESLELYLEQTRPEMEAIARDVLKSSFEEQTRALRTYPLHTCVELCAESCLKILLQLGWNVNERHDFTGSTALHCACKTFRPRMVTMLLDSGADPDITDNRFKTPLMQAIKYRASNCIDALIEGHVNVVAPSNLFAVTSAAAFAAKKNDVHTLRKMFENYSCDELFGGRSDPLILASAYCCKESLEALLKYLMEQNASFLVNVLDEAEGTSPLMMVGVKDKLDDEQQFGDCLTLLLKHGADANTPCKDSGYPSLYHAVFQRWSSEHCLVLVKHTDFGAMRRAARKAIVFETAFNGDTEVMKALHERCSDLVSGEDIRLIAIVFGSPYVDAEMIDFLLAAGVNVNVVAPKSEEDNGDVYSVSHSMYHSRTTPGSSIARLKIINMLLDAGAGENVDVVLKMHYDSSTACLDKRFTQIVVELLRKYATQDHCNSVVSKIINAHGPVNCQTPLSLRHSCRLAVRSSLMLTGRYPSMRKVDAGRLGLPSRLERYVTFSNGG